MSPRNFTRRFAEETGLTPARAVERLRVEVARERVEAGPEPIDQIALHAGFGDPERMRRAFIRGFGQPPQALRRVARGWKPHATSVDCCRRCPYLITSAATQVFSRS